MKEKLSDIKLKLNQLLVELVLLPLPLSYNKLGIKVRKKLSPILIKEFQKTLPYKIDLYKNDYIKSDKPTVYAANHVFFDDIASIMCATNNHMFLIADSDTKKGISILEAVALGLKGVYFFEKEKSKQKPGEVQKMYKTITKLLNNGEDILFFPESTWNFTPNKPIRDDLPWGFIKNVVDEVDADLVPVGIDLVNDKYTVSFGKEITLGDDLKENTLILKDEMATLVWELFEKKPKKLRRDFQEKELDWYNYILEKCGGEIDPKKFDFEKEERCAFRGKNNPLLDESESTKSSLDEVVADLHGIKNHSLSTSYEGYQRVRKLSDDFSKNKR
jgi:hypothetical protein